MLIRLGRVLALAAAILLADGHWALFQSVAWARMIHAGVEPGFDISQVVSETLSGGNPCSMCDAIVDQRSQEEDPAGTEGRIILITLAPISFEPFDVFPPGFRRNQIANRDHLPESADRLLPDPPPRAVTAL